MLAMRKSYDVVIWWSTPVEIASAISRLERMKQLGTAEADYARRLAAELAQLWSVIMPSDAVQNKAIQLVSSYDLRAADALQLAGALQWCEDMPHGESFLSSDQRLREAASLRGFDVL